MEGMLYHENNVHIKYHTHKKNILAVREGIFNVTNSVLVFTNNNKHITSIDDERNYQIVCCLLYLCIPETIMEVENQTGTAQILRHNLY